MANSVWLLDVGNTNTKAIQVTLNTDAESLTMASNLSTYDTPLDWLASESNDIDCDSTPIYFASVRSDTENAIFEQKLSQNGCRHMQIRTEAFRFGLTNAYQRPDKMGVDRWLAMIGAQLITDNAYIVVDAGTAVTLDAVVDDKHIGGWIVPGLKLSKDALTGNTRRVLQAPNEMIALAFGQDTEECVHFGSLAQLSGLLLSGRHVMQLYDRTFDVVLSGGDNKTLQICAEQLEISSNCIRVSNIVMLGLLRYWFEDLGVKNVQKIARSLII